MALAKEGGFAGRALENCGLDEKLLEEYVRRYDGGVTQIHSRAIQVSGEADEVLYQASLAARERDREKVEPVDLLAGILRADQCAAAQLLQSMDVQREMVQRRWISWKKSEVKRNRQKQSRRQKNPCWRNSAGI